jgi:iron complex outermembrane receptor protein
VKKLHIGREAALLSVVLTIGVTAQSQVFAQNQQQQALEEVTVTGTRILRRDFTSQSPIVTVQSETFNERANIGLEAALNQLPQFTVAGTQASTSPASTPFPQATAAPGAATINLRGLGLNRSLVLLDGRRAQPINGVLAVDVNTIPAAAIDRVEVITGGAAAVYGADAIAGVVNFILKKDFEGLQFNGRYGLSQEGDGQETSFSGLFGAGFDDGRGNVMVGVDYSKRKIIYARDRDWVVKGWNDPGTMGGGIGSSNLSQFDPARASFCGVTDCGQPFANAPTAGFPLQGSTYVIDQNGALFDSSDPQNAAHPYTGPLGGDSGFKVNPDGTLGYNDAAHSYLQLPLERYSVFGSGHLQLTDRINAFTQIRYTETFASSSGFVSSMFNVWSPTVPYNPQYDDPNSPDFGNAPAGVAQHPVPAQLAALLNSRPTPDAPWTYVGGLDYLPNFRTETTTNVYQVIGGLNSDITVGSHDWTWELYASHGNTAVNARQPEGFPYLPRIQNLFNADQYGTNFDVSSLPGFVPLAVTGHCTSGLPIFNPDGSVNDTPSVSQDCADYTVLRMNSITGLQQDVIEGNVTGGIAEMPAGSLQFALGADYRREHFSFDPDTGYNANQDYPNVVQNIILPVAVDGTTDVKEIYGELAIPLVSDRKLVQSFELDPGVRYSDYDTVGEVTTYKLLADWTVNDKIRVRGGHQFANRAPNVTELFTPVGGSALAVGTDACAYYPLGTQPWGNRPENPNRLNVQTLCQYLMTREGAPASLYVPGAPSADDYAYNVFGGTTYFPFVIGVTEGNPNLDSESADTYTLGVVLSPLDRLTLSVDWFRIELEQAIGTPGHDTIYQQCLDAQYNPLIGDAPGSHTGAELAAGNPFCDLIQREYVGGAPLTPGNYGADRKYSARYINQGGIKSEGVDLQVDWGIGAFNWNIQASFLQDYSESPFPGADFIDYTGTTVNSSFDYQLFSTLSYNKGPMSIGLRWQHLPQIDPSPSAAPDTRPTNSHNQFDVFGSWTFGDRYRFRWGIDNLLNADPEWVGATSMDNNIGSTNSNYDQIGRRVFLGLTVDM